MEKSKIFRSYFVPHGPLGHNLAPLSQLGFGFNDNEIHEFSLSSSWLWKGTSRELPTPRFAVGFPDEFNQLSQVRNDLSDLQLDLWILRRLSEQEYEGLIEYMKTAPSAKIIITANHLMPWKDLIQNQTVKSWAQEKRAYLQFLPSQHELDPFLKPQEVLWEIENLSGTFPLFVTQFAGATEIFYQTLKQEDHPLLRKSKNGVSFRIFQFLEFFGFRNLILALESFFGFLLEGQFRRLYQMVERIFSSPSWGYKVPICTKRTFDWMMDVFWYRCFFRLFLFLKIGIVRFWVLLRHRLIPFLRQVLWYGGAYRLYILIRFKTLPFLKWLLYPARKIYWFLQYQYLKRIRGVVR